MAASQESTPVHDFGECSPQMISTVSSVQYNLHRVQNTTFCFTLIFDNSRFAARVTFTPFHLPERSFTYHDYEVWCPVPPEKVSCQLQNAIITTAQLLYDRHFLQNAGYHFRFSEQDLHVPDAGKQKRKRSENSEATSEAAASLVWMPQDPHVTTRKNYPSSKRPKRVSSKVTIEDIQVAYKDAHRLGGLQSSSIPQLQQNRSSTAHWDPYIIPANRLDDALLDEDKLQSLQSDLQKVTRIVPLAAKWVEKTQAKNLTPVDIRSILQTACGTIVGQPRLLLDKDTSPVIAIGSAFLNYADHLDTQTRTFPRAVLVARLIGFSVMRVYEALALEDNEKVNEQMQKCYPGADSWQKRSRNLACYWSWMMARLYGWEGREVALYLLLTEEKGERLLRNLFKRSLPAAVGELATILDSKKYFIGVSDAVRMPSIIEIVKCLLSGYVDDVSLCRAFGCPDTYLEGSATDWLERLRTSRDSMMAIEVVKGSLASGSSTEHSPADENYYGEGILQDLDQFPYAFDLFTAHDLDSIENDFLL